VKPLEAEFADRLRLREIFNCGQDALRDENLAAIGGA
jgi:hypothetical protein